MTIPSSQLRRSLTDTAGGIGKNGHVEGVAHYESRNLKLEQGKIEKRSYGRKRRNTEKDAYSSSKVSGKTRRVADSFKTRKEKTIRPPQ